MLQHDWSSAIPKGPMSHLFISLHWLTVAARIKFKTLMLAYRTATGSAPSYFHSLMTIYIERRLMVLSQRGTKSRFSTFSFTVSGWWNELPTPIRNAESLTIFKQHLKTHLFLFLLHKKTNKQKKQTPLLSFLNLSLSS